MDAFPIFSESTDRYSINDSRGKRNETTIMNTFPIFEERTDRYRVHDCDDMMQQPGESDDSFLSASPSCSTPSTSPSTSPESTDFNNYISQSRKEAIRRRRFNGGFEVWLGKDLDHLNPADVAALASVLCFDLEANAEARLQETDGLPTLLQSRVQMYETEQYPARTGVDSPQQTLQNLQASFLGSEKHPDTNEHWVDSLCPVHIRLSPGIIRELDKQIDAFVYETDVFNTPSRLETLDIMGCLYEGQWVRDEDGNPVFSRIVPGLHHTMNWGEKNKCAGCRLRRIFSEQCCVEALVVASTGKVHEIAVQAWKRTGEIYGVTESLERLLEERENLGYGEENSVSSW
ncbi:hypothetical protein FPQ18DRAFT_130577 [Pyronema domesticum]|nr:hypothetical protein FPQ18DRAFT_130577 [Pyronema domesticum]